MSDPKRIKSILKRIKIIWIKYPDMRLGQLLDNLRVIHNLDHLFYVEDDRLIKGLEELYLKEK